MTWQQACDWIGQTNGKIFAIRFKKRSTGEIREMICRTGVKRDLAEKPDKSKVVRFADNHLIPVFDIQADAYKSIPIEGIMEVKIAGVWEKITHA